ncbi:hypothetical protein DITRI_Ditri14bG0109200 [Diplodiscus trichospermus]
MRENKKRSTEEKEGKEEMAGNGSVAAIVAYGGTAGDSRGRFIHLGFFVFRINGEKNRGQSLHKLDTVFSWPFCNHGTGVECGLDMKNLIGEAVCRICQESFSTTITDTVNGLMNVNGSTTLKMMVLKKRMDAYAF